jgi:hypothetical protein
MERVTFLVEKTRLRLDCMLNPESLVVERMAGVRPRRSPGGLVTAPGMTDDPLLYTGGGRTELKMDLLFDVSLAPAGAPPPEDVRDLTRPLWNLSENGDDEGYGRPPLVRFVWGKSWNVLGVVASVSERLEYFNAEGAPRRSWLRLKLVRVAEPQSRADEASPPGADDFSGYLEDTGNVPEEAIQSHPVIGGGSEGPGSTERLDVLAQNYYGDSRLWKIIALFNDVDDPSNLAPGQILRIPPASPSSGGGA